MKKYEFRTFLKEKKHIAYKNTWFLGAITISFLIGMCLATVLAFSGKIPLRTYFISEIILIILIGIPGIVYDQLNDKEIRRIHRHYLAKKKLISSKNYTKQLKLWLIIDSIVLVVLFLVIASRYIF